MPTLADIHQETRALCDMKFGFGVSFEFLQHAVDFEIQKVAQGSFLKNMPFPYSGLAVTAEIPSGSIKVRIAGGSTEFTVDAEIRIAIHIDGDRNAFLAEDVITYTNGKATVVPNPNGTRLQYSAGAHGKFTVTLGPNPANLDALLTQIGMVDSNGNPDVNQFNLLRNYEAAHRSGHLNSSDGRARKDRGSRCE